MLDYEFKTEMARLAAVFPQHFSSQPRMQLIFERVKDLEHIWLRRVVDRIILANDPKFNFDEAARGERLARKNTQLVDDVIKASEKVSQAISEKGLENVLEAMGAKSLIEAIHRPAPAQPAANRDGSRDEN